MSVYNIQYKIGDNHVVIYKEASTKQAVASLLKEGGDAFMLDMDQGIDDS